ncbi:MAG: ATPase, T2SS/T4P/T4SS family [Candidatus Eremiobacterota bacterium]
MVAKKDSGDLLVKGGYIDEANLEKAREEAKKSGDSLEKALVSLDYFTGKEITGILAKEYGVPFIDLDEVEIDSHIVRTIPEHLARRYKVIPVEQKDCTLVLAMADPLNVFAIDDARLITGFNIEPAMATEESIIREIGRQTGRTYSEKPDVPKEVPYYNKEKITEGTMFVKDIKNFSLPLKYTEVRAAITGMISDVTVTQKFYNELSQNIEAIYMFPLPHESAVHDFEIIIDKRVIKSEIKEREEARRTYEKAKREMKKAGLLEQERPNIFTVSVANIEPGKEILVNLRYSETLKYEDGTYEFVFPMTITPRYGGEDSKGVPDFLEGKNSPPIIPPQEDGGREVKIFINLHAGFEPDITSPTHKIFIEEKNGEERHIELSQEGEIPNKDFVLNYKSKGEKMEHSFTFYREEGKSGTFMFHITPKIQYGPEEMLKREIIFVLDRSGSMSDGPMEHAKKAIKNCLKTLREVDTFSIIAFDNTVESMSEELLPLNRSNILLAKQFLKGINSRGGTEILLALKHALAVPVNKGYLRQIVFLTDGAVWDEDSSLKEILKNLGNSRIFTFGIGPSVNRYFLSKIAELGRGTCHFITATEEIEEAIEKFSIQTSCPIASDLSLEWEGAGISDTYPFPVPDIYFSEVLCLTGRFHSSGKAKATLCGIKGTGDFKEEFFVELPEKDEKYPVIETIWARRSVEALMDKIRENPAQKAEIRDEIIGIALKYKLMTPYTSLVAVEQDIEEEREKKEIIKIDVPQVLPEGLNYDAFTEPSQSSYNWSGSTDLCEVNETVQDIACADFGYFEDGSDIEEHIELDHLKELVDEAPVIRVVDLIISQAIKDGASDIHIENREKNMCVRYRIDGILQEVMSPPKHIDAPLIGRIKIMANLDIAEKRIPHQGKIHIKQNNQDYELHVSTLPTVKGEKIVIHIQGKIFPELNQMGFSSDTELLFKKLISSSSGLIIVTGQSDTGKTVTLYNALQMLNNEKNNITTIEDRVKHHIEGINQVEVNYKYGLTTGTIVQHCLTQDSDIIMVKDMHGCETTALAVRGALTGQLVLSNLYRDYAADVPAQLINMGIEPFLVASALKGVIAQRLVRKICEKCRVSYSPPEEIRKEFGINDDTLLYRGTGCDHCKGSGYKGRTGIYEIMTVDEEIRSLIIKRASPEEIRDLSVKNGMVTIEKDLLKKVLDGITTVEEYFLVTRNG